MAGRGITEVYEIGSGKVLSGLVKRIAPAITATSIGTPADIEAVRGALL
jgi:[acyl-carrier-protein] S-malonyltransferase